MSELEKWALVCPGGDVPAGEMEGSGWCLCHVVQGEDGRSGSSQRHAWNLAAALTWGLQNLGATAASPKGLGARTVTLIWPLRISFQRLRVAFRGHPTT